MWFPKLKNTLGLACLLPVFIKGSLVLSEGTGWDAEPSFLFQTIPLPPEEASKVEVQLVGQRENIGVDWETAKSQWREIWRLVSVYRPGTEGWAKPYEIETALSVYKDMPATVQAYQWLWDDLHTLRLVRNKNCPVRDD
jgi:hypothetical protein